jgi:polar amino acid transport system substrate-binding protein
LHQASGITFQPVRDVAALGGIIVVALLVWLGQTRTLDLDMEAIATSGVLRVGIDPTYPPFSIMREGRVEGYEAELAKTIAADLGVRAEFVPLALDSLYDALAADKVDILVSSLPFIYERQKEVRYSQPYYDAGQVLVVRRSNSRIRETQDLAGRSVGVELGSAADTEARRLSRDGVRNIDLQTFDTPQEALDALISRDIDAAITDTSSAYSYARAHPGSISIVSPPLTSEPYVIAMPAGATSLAEQVNATIARLRASGELAKLMGIASEE